MAWLRLSDDYVDDEKIQILSDGAFRLWHEGAAYCRRHQTDGLIPFAVLRGLRSFTKGREKQLASPAREGLRPLWKLIPGVGYQMNNYLDWNPSKEEENERRAESKERMRDLRDRRCLKGVPPNRLPRSQDVCANTARSDADVLGLGMDTGSTSEKGSGEKLPPGSDARSKRPVFSGQRLTVFEWMLTECLNTLGPHADAFDLHEWFFQLDAYAVQANLVIPKRDGGAWLQKQLVTEAQRRGLPLAFATDPATDFDAELARLTAKGPSVRPVVR